MPVAVAVAGEEVGNRVAMTVQRKGIMGARPGFRRGWMKRSLLRRGPERPSA